MRYWISAIDWAGNVGTGPEREFTEAGRPPVSGDLDGDGVVNGADLGMMLADWEGGASSRADLNGDGRVDGLDLGVLLANWTA